MMARVVVSGPSTSITLGHKTSSGIGPKIAGLPNAKHSRRVQSRVLGDQIEKRLNSMDVIDRPTGLCIIQGVPAYIRSDNGPEFIAQAVRQWIKDVGAAAALSSLCHPGRTAIARASTPVSGTNSLMGRYSTP